MAEIKEFLEDAGDNTKKLLKKKPFVIAAVGVGLVGLFVWWQRKQAAASDGAAGYAVGYSGYPTVSGGSDSATDSDNYAAMLEELTKGYDSTMDSYFTAISDLGDQVTEIKSVNESMTQQMKRDNAIAQMRANSELYNNITDTATKQALHAENLALADKYGFTFDGNSGNYFSGNSVVYTTSKQQAQTISGKSPTAQTATFQSNVDYQKEINKAITEGASASVINNLNEQRNAKIAATGGSVGAVNATFDQKTDYQALINKATASGASKEIIDNLTAQRNAKIAASKK